MENKRVFQKKPTETFQKVLKYYETVVFHEMKSDPTSVIHPKRRFPSIYLISRLVVATTLIYLIRLLYVCILEWRTNGSSIALQVSELFLYILAYCMIPYFDIAIFKSEILPNIEKTVQMYENIWNKIGCMKKQAKKLQKEMEFKMWQLFFHNW